MSIRAMISFDVMKEERLYHVLIPNGAPFQEAKEALAQVLGTLELQEKADKEKAQQATPIETPEVVS